MQGINEVLGWSLRLGRIFGTEVRVSWLLGVWMLFEGLNFAHGPQPALIAVGFLVPLAAMTMHALGHAVACRVVGGRLQATTLSILNNQDEMQLALRPGAHFIAGLAGPLVNLLLAGVCSIGSWYVHGFLAVALSYATYLNLVIGIGNLLACQPFDGHRWWRGLLWNFMPMRKAVQASLMLGFISAILLLVFAVSRSDFLLLFVGICSLLATISDRMAMANGHDPIFLVDPTYAGSAQPSTWQRKRTARAAAKADGELATEQEILDRLLTKVGEHGLPSLTSAERKQLQQISQRQKQRNQA